MHTRHAHLYAHVHVLLWPWLCWQLARLDRWMKETVRGPLVSVDRWGNVYVLHMSDAPWAEDLYVRAPVSARLAAALAGPCPRRKPGPRSILSGRAARGLDMRREHGRLNGLPLPYT
jgi:hypothetical protein